MRQHTNIKNLIALSGNWYGVSVFAQLPGFEYKDNRKT